MKNLLFIIMLCVYTFASTINQKMIIAASKNSVEAEQILRTAQLFVTEFKQFPQLDTKIEKLNEYFLVTMSPIDSIPLKHELYSVLKTKFSGIFTIDNVPLEKEVRVRDNAIKPKVEPKIPQIIVPPKVKISKSIKGGKEEKRLFVQNIDGEWYALLGLALAGLMLIMRSHNQIRKITKLQMELELIQEKSDKQL